MKSYNLIEEIEAIESLFHRWEENGTVPIIERDIALTSLQQLYERILSIEPRLLINAAPRINLLKAPPKQLTASQYIDQESEPSHESGENESVDNPSETNDQQHFEQTSEQSYDHAEQQFEQPSEQHTEQFEQSSEQHAEQQFVHAEQHAEQSNPHSAGNPQVEPTDELFGQQVPRSLIQRFVEELFWRDEQFYANETEKLANQPDFENALFYISQKYTWSATSQTAEQFIELLAQNHFNDDRG